MTAALVHEIALQLAAFGRPFAIVNGIIFASSFVYLIILVIRKGKVGEDQGRVVTRRRMVGDPLRSTPGVSKEKVPYSRSKFVTIESLVDGTASNDDWRLAIGINASMFFFMLMFVGIGLSFLPRGGDLPFWPGALLFIAFPFMFTAVLIKSQYKDYKKAREKLERKRMRATVRA